MLRNGGKMFKAFLIKYAEIGVKGKNRYMFEDALVQQIKYALKKCEGEFYIHKTQGRIFVDALSEFDFEGNELGRAFEYSESDEYRDSGDWQPFAGADGRGSDFLLVSKNEVWHYEKGKEYLKYKFDLGEYDMPDKYKIEGAEYILKNRLHKQYGLGVTNLWESNKYRFADIHIQGDEYLCILDKKNNDIISFSKSKYLNVFDVSPGKIIRTDGDYLLSYHSGMVLYQLREYIWKVNPENIKGKGIDLYNISQGLSADDNGVVLMMKLKH
jgi:hypothetical protein